MSLRHPFTRLLLGAVTLSLFYLAACAPVTATPLPVKTSLPSRTSLPSKTPPASTSTPTSTTMLADRSQVFVLSLTDHNYSHLFAFTPGSPYYMRLTQGAWDDITPTLSPDGTQIAFASRRNGYWDLYLLTLATGEVSRLTDTPEYEGAPSWSPDGVWLVYETYVDGNLELFVRSVKDPTQPAIPVTQDTFTDRSPSWIPVVGERQVAFVSNRSGEDEIWVADLGRTGEERFSNVSKSPNSIEDHPAWSADGNLLAWSSTAGETGLSGIYVWDSRTPDVPAVWLGSGDWPIWQSDTQIATRLSTPNSNLFTAYSYPAGELVLPPARLPGTLSGLTYLPNGLSDPLPEPFLQAAAFNPGLLYIPMVTPFAELPGGRAALITIDDIQAPYPQLHDAVDESFLALRARVAAETGWDALAALENAYVPLTTPLDPGLGQDWLFTGRAFSLNPLLVNAGMVIVARENFGPQTFWRIYLRTGAQDGSMGAPLRQIPWDLNARYGGNPVTYQQGGQFMQTIPAGYWFDLTALAIEYGWERQPALPNWRTYYNGARFNEFAMTQGLDWRTAMLELYPPDIFITPTVVIPPTRTPTRTPWGWITPTPSLTPTPRPTFTPSP